MGISRVHPVGLLLLLTLFAAETPAAPNVVGYELVSKKRSGRTTVDYTYRLRVRNQGNPYSSIVLTATSSSAATSILEGDVYLTFIDSNETVRTDDTFTIRQDRLQRTNLGAISWQIGGRELVPSTEPVEIVAVSFVEFAGVPEHAGWLPIDTKPVSDANEPGMLQLDLTAQLTNGRVDLIGASDTVLATAPLSPLVETDTILTDYLASVPVPAQSFRVRVVGTDRIGRATSRTWPTAFTPSTINVRLDSLDRSVAAGGTLVLPVQLVNSGAAQNLRVSVTSLSPQLQIETPAVEVLLANAESRIERFAVRIMDGAATFSTHHVRIAAVSLTDATTSNELEISLEVAPN